MKEARYFYVPELFPEGELPQEEVGHAVRVLHLKPHDIIWLTNGKGLCYEAEVTMVNKHSCNYRCLSVVECPRTWQGKLHLAVAPTKNIDRTEWLVEKATEIGLDRISFLSCKHSERKQIRLDRIQKIAISAMKQSHKSHLPQLDELCDFQRFIEQEFNGQKFIAHCYSSDDINANTNKPHLFDAIDREQDTMVLIGPEGDFNIEEVRQAIAAGYIPISLGESRLRTETAALTAVHIMQLLHRPTN